MTDTLRQRFGQSKIYLMRNSGGSFIGIQAAARAPERYHGYMGVAQMSYQLESERLAWEYMLQQLRARGDTRMVKKLEAAPVTLAGGVPLQYAAIRDVAMHRLGIGTMHGMRSLLTGLVLPSLLFPEYTLREKAHSPMFEEPEKMNRILREDVLTSSNRLADAPPPSSPGP